MHNSLEIFNYLKPENNNQLSTLKIHHLNELIYYLSKYYLELRPTINLNDNTTFGAELEISTKKKNKIKILLNKITNEEWIIEDEYSIINGSEIKSPILKDNEETWKIFKEVCIKLQTNSKIDRDCGGHIHIGAQILGNNYKYWRNFSKLWSTYENIVYRFCYGTFLTERPLINVFAEPISKNLWEEYSFLNLNKSANPFKCLKDFSRNKSNAFYINAEHDLTEIKKGNTIEFRCPNASLNPVIWQNNINLLVKLLYYCTKNNFDNDTIDKRKELTNDYDNLLLYREIFLEQALEFCDLIFDNNLDKIYFLRQYLKDFKTGNKSLEKAKTFTKK